MNKKTFLLTGTSGFIGYNFLEYILSKKHSVIDVLRIKNKHNIKLNQLKRKYSQNYKTIYFKDYKELKKKIKKY